MAAPARPPSRAWDDDDGRPNHQVIRFQVIAPSSAAQTTVGLTTSGTMSPLEMVLATAVPTTKAARKLNEAAQSTANRGDRTRVATTVAMELALSWKPLMKSKTRATTITASTKPMLLVHRRQPCLMVMDSSTFAASSALSSVFSRVS